LGKFLTRFTRDESGATAIEYGLILAGVFLLVLGAMTAFGNNASAVLTKASAAIVAAQ
jgi:pilus assembly protein Flp/PilA